MKKLILLALLFSFPSFAGIFPNIGVDAYIQAPMTRSYSAQSPWGAPYALPTDLCTISGIAGITIKVLHIRVFSNQTTAGVNGIWVLKRSSINNNANTALTVVPHDSNLPAASADVIQVTAGGTTGTLVGLVRGADIFTGQSTSINQSWFDFDFSPTSGAAPIILHTNEVAALNFQGQAVPTGFKYSCEFNWSEE